MPVLNVVKFPMVKITLQFGLLCLAILSMSCQTTPLEMQKNIPLSEALKSKDIISLPYRLYHDRVFTVDVISLDGKTLPFLIDTGATKSALYRRTLPKLGLKPEDGREIQIHGMHKSGARPVVSVPNLTLGTRALEGVEFAILKNRVGDKISGLHPAGLIGMDILSDYRIYVDAKARTFNLIPRTIPSPKIPYKWETVRLETNPFSERDHGLHFMKIRVGNQLMPALLDTGSEDNLMSWNVSKFPQLRRARKRLYEDWLMEGAIGEFDPDYAVSVKNMRSGQKYWEKSEFLVVDFKGLGILGVEDQSFLIAGSALLVDETFYVDFAENLMRFKPELETRRARSLTSTNSVYQDKDRAQ